MFQVTRRQSARVLMPVTSPTRGASGAGDTTTDGRRLTAGERRITAIRPCPRGRQVGQFGGRATGDHGRDDGRRS